MTLENVLHTANAHTTGARENGTARTEACPLDIKLSPVAVSSTLIFIASWKKWSCILRHHNGFGLFDSVRFGFWLARGGAGATPVQGLADELRAAVIHAISYLRENLRTVVLLRELQGLTSAETARRLGLTVSAVKARTFHARHCLRRHFEVKHWS